MKALGIDYGKARIGLAVSDDSGLLAAPLEVLQRTSPDADLERLAATAARLHVDHIIVGMPLQLDGTRGPAAGNVERFAAELSRRTEVPVELWDERLTTAQAERAMIDADASRRRRKQHLDAVAAQMMLQCYLDAHRSRP